MKISTVIAAAAVLFAGTGIALAPAASAAPSTGGQPTPAGHGWIEAPTPAAAPAGHEWIGTQPAATPAGHDWIGTPTPATRAALVPVTAAASVCPDNHWTRSGGTGRAFAGTGVNIRTGPSTACTSVGQGQPSHNVRVDCFKRGGDGQLWSHLQDLTTGVSGWSRTSLLTFTGGNC